MTLGVPQPSELPICAALVILYTAYFFGRCYLVDKAPVFSRRNARSTFTVIGVHVSALLILIVLTQIALRLYWSSPVWLTDGTLRTRGGATSIFLVLYLASVVAIGEAEKRSVYAESSVVDPESKGGDS